MRVECDLHRVVVYNLISGKGTNMNSSDKLIKIQTVHGTGFTISVDPISATKSILSTNNALKMQSPASAESESRGIGSGQSKN